LQPKKETEKEKQFNAARHRGTEEGAKDEGDVGDTAKRE
jgi:hypothetical protein